MFRIFSKKLILILIITVANLVIGINTGISFFYLFFIFLATVFAVGLAWVTGEYFGANLCLERNIIAKIEEDDTLEIEAIIKNKSFFPVFNLSLEDSLDCASISEKHKFIFIDCLGAKSTLSIKYRCLCLKRGKYTVGSFVVYFFDPFGLFFFKKTFRVYSDVYVYPKTFRIKKFPALAKGILPWFGIETTWVSGDEDEFFGVREYKQGDPIKMIHWFSSARKNSLMVKQFQRQSYFRATIIFNLEKSKNFGEGKESIAEYIIKIAASVVKYLLSQNVSVEVIAHTQELVHIPFNKGGEHFDNIMKFFTIAQAESKVSINEIFQEYSPYITDDSSLIVIMLDKDWEYLSEMLALRKRNVSLVPLILLSSTFISSFEKEDAISDAKQKVSQVFNFNPIIFSRGDRLEEPFLK